MNRQTHLSAEIELEIPFHDVDPANIVWHGHYVRYIELARCKLLDLFNYNYRHMAESGYFWPVIDLRLRYPNPARFQQIIKVRATLAEWEHRLKITYLITDAKTGERIVKGYSVQVAVEAETGEMLLASPPVIYEKLGLPVPEFAK